MLEKLKNHKSTLIGIEELRKYAVCIPLMPGPDGYEVLFEVRSANVKSQPGDVCFPGGRMEPGETPDETAVRETMEELLVEDMHRLFQWKTSTYTLQEISMRLGLPIIY